MSTWTIQVETPAETTRDEDALARFNESLIASDVADGAATLLDAQLGALSASFQVEAPNEQEAALQGCFAYWRALAAAGVELGSESRLSVSYGTRDDAGNLSEPSVGFRVLVARERTGGD